ncbi:MAG: hypothetical protein AB1393_08160 [Candidatus Edwardsbacteria bacterium]
MYRQIQTNGDGCKRIINICTNPVRKRSDKGRDTGVSLPARGEVRLRRLKSSDAIVRFGTTASVCIGIFILFIFWPVLLFGQQQSGASCPVDSQVFSQKKDTWFGQDKFKHLIVSLSLIGFSYHLLHRESDFSQKETRFLSISGTALAGLLKELYDWKRRPTGFSKKDLVADAVGIAAGVMIFAK